HPSLERAETQRAGHRAIEHLARHLARPVALACQPVVHTVEVDTRDVGCDFERGFAVGLREHHHGQVSRGKGGPETKKPRIGGAAWRSTLAIERHRTRAGFGVSRRRRRRTIGSFMAAVWYDFARRVSTGLQEAARAAATAPSCLRYHSPSPNRVSHSVSRL